MEDSFLTAGVMFVFLVLVFSACAFVVLWAYSGRVQVEEHEKWFYEIDKLVDDIQERRMLIDDESGKIEDKIKHLKDMEK
jgi:hypothetical protein